MRSRQWIALLFLAYVPMLLASAFTVATIHTKDGQATQPVPAIAGSELPASFCLTLFRTTEVNGVLLEPGEYSIRLERNNTDLTVSFLRTGVVEALAHADLVPRETPSRYSAALVHPDAEGRNNLTELVFEGKTSALVLSPTTVASLGRNSATVVNDRAAPLHDR